MLLATSPASACYGWKCEQMASREPSRSYITNTHRKKVGDVYDPGAGRRLQVRDKHRRILFYIERDGTVTNTHRQKVGTVEELD